MTKLPGPGGHWILSRQTRLESGKEHADGIDVDGIAVRTCRVQRIPGTHPLSPESVNVDDNSNTGESGK